MVGAEAQIKKRQRVACRCVGMFRSQCVCRCVWVCWVVFVWATATADSNNICKYFATATYSTFILPPLAARGLSLRFYLIAEIAASRCHLTQIHTHTGTNTYLLRQTGQIFPYNFFHMATMKHCNIFLCPPIALLLYIFVCISPKHSLNSKAKANMSFDAHIRTGMCACVCVNWVKCVIFVLGLLAWQTKLIRKSLWLPASKLQNRWA